MNVCLISSAPRSSAFRSPVLDEIAGLGFRVVVLFLEPQPRMLWNQGNVVLYSPFTHFGKEPLEVTFRRQLDDAREVWRRPIQKGVGPAYRIARGIERRSYVALRYVGGRAFGRIGHVIGKAQAVLSRPLGTRNPFQRIPQGEASYGVFHALDAGALPQAGAVAARTGALLIKPGETRLRERYEAAILHWLKV